MHFSRSQIVVADAVYPLSRLHIEEIEVTQSLLVLCGVSSMDKHQTSVHGRNVVHSSPWLIWQFSPFLGTHIKYV